MQEILREMPKENLGADFQARVEKIRAQWMKEAIRKMATVFGTILTVASVAGILT